MALTGGFPMAFQGSDLSHNEEWCDLLPVDYIGSNELRVLIQ